MRNANATLYLFHVFQAFQAQEYSTELATAGETYGVLKRIEERIDNKCCIPKVNRATRRQYVI